MINLRALQRAFDIEGYLKLHDQGAKQYGANVAVRCPACNKDGKLWVLVTDKATTEAGAWVCYYCDEGGRDVFSLIRRIEECDTIEALAVLMAHQSVDRRGGKPLTDLRALVLQTLDGVAPTETWDETPLTPVPLPAEFISADHASPPRYFQDRGLSTKRIRIHGLGYCRDGYFRNRLIIPVRLHGEHQFFVARYMKPKPPDGVKKTLYPKGARPNRVLFNYDRAQHCDRIILVEGVLDAIAVGRNAVATFGTSFSQYQLDLLLRTSASEIVVLWDLDAITKAHELARRLAEFWRVRVVELPDARDPDEWSRADLRGMIDASPVLDAGAAFAASVRARL